MQSLYAASGFSMKMRWSVGTYPLDELGAGRFHLFCCKFRYLAPVGNKLRSPTPLLCLQENSVKRKVNLFGYNSVSSALFTAMLSHLIFTYKYWNCFVKTYYPCGWNEICTTTNLEGRISLSYPIISMPGAKGNRFLHCRGSN